MLPPIHPVRAQQPAGVPCVLGIVTCNPLSGLGGDAVKAIATGMFQAFAQAVADGVAGTLDALSAAITKTTAVRLDASWFQEHFAAMRSLALLILLPLVLVGILSAVIHRDAAQLWRAGLVHIPVAVLAGAALLLLTEEALQLTDWATAFVTGDLASSGQAALATLKAAVEQFAQAGAPGLAFMLVITVLLLLMIGALLLWLELLVRGAAIYVVVLFLPLALSGLVWKTTVHWTRKMLEALAALILSKFVIVVVIDLAAGMITAGDGVGTVMEGATLLLLAAAAPFVLLRLVPIVESSAIGHLEGEGRRPIAAAKRAGGAAARMALMGADATHLLSQNGGGASSPASSPPQGPPPPRPHFAPEGGWQAGGGGDNGADGMGGARAAGGAAASTPDTPPSPVPATPASSPAPTQSVEV